MDEIKPLMLMDGKPIYDAAALEQARIAGMREAIEICMKYAKRDTHFAYLCVSRGEYAGEALANAINRAIEEKGK
jgi:hypothetical protein